MSIKRRGRLSQTIAMLHELIANGLTCSVENDLCPPVRVLHKHDMNDAEILNVTLYNIDYANYTYELSNGNNVSFLNSGKDLTGVVLTNGIKEVHIIEHIDGNPWATNDIVKVEAKDLDNFQVGSLLKASGDNSVFISAEPLNLAIQMYANRALLKTEAFILKLEIKTRDDATAYDLDDLTDALRDVLDSHQGGNLSLGNGKYVRILQEPRVSNTVIEGDVLQKRTIRVMMGYNVVNSLYT